MRRFLARMVKGNFQTNISLVFFFEILVSSRWEFSFFRLRLKDLGIFELEFKTPKKSLSAEDLKYFVRGRYGSLNLSRLTANTPDEAPLGMCARKVKVDDFDQVFWWNPFQIASEINIPAVPTKASFHCLKRQFSTGTTPPWWNPWISSVQAEVAQAAKRQFRELRRTFRIFSLCVPEKQGDSDFGPSWTDLSQLKSSLKVSFSWWLFWWGAWFFWFWMPVVSWATWCSLFSPFGSWLLARTQNWEGFFGLVGFGSLPSSRGAWQDSLSSDEIYHTYSLMVWQSICAIFHSGILEFGDREMLFFLLLSSI